MKILHFWIFPPKIWIFQTLWVLMRLARAESCWRRFWNFGSDHCRYFWSDLSDPKPKLVLSMLRPNRSGFIHSVNLTSYEWRSKQRKREGEIKEREKMGQNFKVEIATRKRQKILLWLSWMLRLECSIQVSGMLILGSNFSTPPCKLMLREVFFIWWQVWSEKIQFFFNV